MKKFISNVIFIGIAVLLPSISFAETILEGNEVFVESGFETKCEGDDVAKCAMIKVVNNTFQGQTCEVTVEYLGGDICDGATLRRATVGGIKIGQKTSAVATKRIIPTEVPIKICGISNTTIKSCKDDGLWSFSYVPNRNDYKDRVRYGERGWRVPEVLPNNPEGKRRRPEMYGQNMHNTDGGYTSYYTYESMEAGKVHALHPVSIKTKMQVLDHETVKLLQSENKAVDLVVEFNYDFYHFPDDATYTGELSQIGEVSCTIDGKNSRKYYRFTTLRSPEKGVLKYVINGFDVDGCESGAWFFSWYFGRYQGKGKAVRFNHRIHGFRWKMKLANELENPES